MPIELETKGTAALTDSLDAQIQLANWRTQLEKEDPNAYFSLLGFQAIWKRVLSAGIPHGGNRLAELDSAYCSAIDVGVPQVLLEYTKLRTYESQSDADWVFRSRLKNGEMNRLSIRQLYILAIAVGSSVDQPLGG